MTSRFAIFNSLCRWSNHFSRRLFSVAVVSKCSLVCWNCTFKSQWWLWMSQFNCLLCLCIFYYLWAANAILTLNFTGYFQCMEVVRDCSSLPLHLKHLKCCRSGQLVMLQLEEVVWWMGTYGIAGVTVNRVVKCIFRGRENISWIITCYWWHLSYQRAYGSLHSWQDKVLANVCTFKLDLESIQWRNINSTKFCKTEIIERTCPKDKASCILRHNSGQAYHK